MTVAPRGGEGAPTPSRRRPRRREGRSHAEEPTRRGRHPGDAGARPGFFASVPDYLIESEWASFKALQLSETAIPNKYKELIGLGVAGATRCRYCAYFHTEAARLFGATEDEITEAVLSPSPAWAGAPTSTACRSTTTASATSSTASWSTSGPRPRWPLRSVPGPRPSPAGSRAPGRGPRAGRGGPAPIISAAMRAAATSAEDLLAGAGQGEDVGAHLLDLHAVGRLSREGSRHGGPVGARYAGRARFHRRRARGHRRGGRSGDGGRRHPAALRRAPGRRRVAPRRVRPRRPPRAAWARASASGCSSAPADRSLSPVQPGGTAGRGDPVHDHLAWGLVGLYRGSQDEEVFRAASTDGLEPVLRRPLGPGDLYPLIPPARRRAPRAHHLGRDLGLDPPPHNDTGCVLSGTPTTPRRARRGRSGPVTSTPPAPRTNEPGGGTWPTSARPGTICSPRKGGGPFARYQWRVAVARGASS